MKPKRNFSRQLDILDPDKYSLWPVTIIGCGGIGRFTLEILAEMGIGEIIIYDQDAVEEENRPNQAWRKIDLEKPKVMAGKEIVEQFAEDCEVAIHQEKFTEQELQGIVISAVDSMESRKAIWEKVRWNPLVPLFIDGRLGGEILEIYTAKPMQNEDIEAYEATLFSDEEATPGSCTAKSIVYVGHMIGSLISLQVKKFLKEEKIRREIIFDLKTMTLLLDGETAN